jgi:hypothetical protein
MLYCTVLWGDTRWYKQHLVSAGSLPLLRRGCPSVSFSKNPAKIRGEAGQRQWTAQLLSSRVYISRDTPHHNQAKRSARCLWR